MRRDALLAWPDLGNQTNIFQPYQQDPTEPQSQMGRAARLLGAAAALRVALAPEERARHERVVATTRAALGEDTFQRAWAEGQHLSLEDAVAEAMEAT